MIKDNGYNGIILIMTHGSNSTLQSLLLENKVDAIISKDKLYQNARTIVQNVYSECSQSKFIIIILC